MSVQKKRKRNMESDIIRDSLFLLADIKSIIFISVKISFAYPFINSLCKLYFERF